MEVDQLQVLMCVCVWVVIPFVWSTATEAVPLQSTSLSFDILYFLLTFFIKNRIVKDEIKNRLLGK